jgi:non-heme Fe2+,alpha-ketoglutarate-dependent halogenase
MDTDNSLSPEQIRRYERDGIAYPIRIMSASEAQRFRAGFEELETHLSRELKYVAMTHLYFRWAFDLSTYPNILNAVEQILGPDVLVQGTLILCKQANDSSFVAWHQDLNYTIQNSSPTISAWVALSNSTRRSGCMRVIPGSHKEDILPHSDSAIENNMVPFSVEVDRSRAIDIELRAGEMSLHDAGIVHGSSPNQSDDKRIGFIIRFVTPQYKQTVNPVVRARGKKACQHLTLWPGPPGDNLEHNIRAWTEFVRKRNLLK